MGEELIRPCDSEFDGFDQGGLGGRGREGAKRIDGALAIEAGLFKRVGQSATAFKQSLGISQIIV